MIKRYNIPFRRGTHMYYRCLQQIKLWDGKCIKCSNTVRPGSIHCTRHLGLASIRNKRRYKMFKDSGLCVACSTIDNPVKARESLDLCEECANIKKIKGKHKRSESIKIDY